MDDPPAILDEPHPGGLAYPGDGAPKEQIARWMAAGARSAGLPPELPVMAALVESGLSNLESGDRDSVGFFQMRADVWNRGEYAGFPHDAGLQLRWFLDMARRVRDARAGTTPGFGQDSADYGEWIADVERPAPQYRGRYQQRLPEATALIRG